MSEPRRVAFNTISSSVSQSTLAAAAAGGSSNAYRSNDIDSALTANKNAAAAFGASGDHVDVSKNRSKHNRTFRLELTLFQTDSSKYPEFDYSRLIYRESKKLNKLKTRMNGFNHDPFDDGNDDDCNRIARELEEKYGSSYGSGRIRKNMANDIGTGYDESDSFIDNTEAFDEYLPEEAETIEGGFYINCGALEFKKLHTEQLPKTKTDEIIKMPNRPKKSELSTSSSEDTSTTDEDEDVVDDEEAEDEMGDDSSTTNNRQKSGNSSSSTTTSVHTKKSSAGSGNKSTENKKQIILSSSSNSPKPMGEEMGSDSDKDRVPVKTITVKDMIKAKRDNFLKNQINEEKATNSSGVEKNAENKSTDDEDEDSSSSTGDSDDSDDSAQFEDAVGISEKESLPNTVIQQPITIEEENKKKQEVKLPAGLSINLIELLNSFKDIAMSKGMIGKKFQFDQPTTEHFLKIDNILITLDKATRNLVLAHLEYQLQLKKYYFLRKEKQFRIREQKQKNKRALAKLKKCIIEIMPMAIGNYEAELRKYADLNAANINSDIPPIMPKKEFPWNNNLSNILYEVYEVRLSSYTVLRTRKDSFEEFINEYLRSKVLTLWPHGWVRFEHLISEIEKVKLTQSATNMKKTEPIAAITTVSADIAIISPAVTTNIMPNAAVTVAVPTTNKRKHAEGGATKPRKNKSQKKAHMNDVATNSKKVTDVNITENPINLQQQSHQNAAAFSILQQQQHKQTHSIPTNVVGSTKTAHVIDLDNYKSANDILQTSKQIINAAHQQQQQHQQQVGINFKPETVQVQESGSESDGVEIVSVYQNRPTAAKNMTNKQKTNKNLDPLSMNFPVPLNLNNNNYNNKKGNIKVNMESLLKDSKSFEQMPTATIISKNLPPTRTANNQ